MHPVLVQVGPSLLTHDAFTVLALVVGLAIYYRELRRRAGSTGGSSGLARGRRSVARSARG